MRYESIVFLQGDDFISFETILNDKGERAAFQHLLELRPDNAESLSVEPWAIGDIVVWFNTRGYRWRHPLRRGYVMAYRTSLSYAGLCRVSQD